MAISTNVDLAIRVGRLSLPNPILTASGTFGYAREMEGLVDLARLGGIVPKTITRLPRIGNAPRRTVETSGGMLNSIGLDNDGVEYFCENHLPYLRARGAPLVVSVAGKDIDDFFFLAERVGRESGVAAVELNVSCPNVSGGVDFGADPALCRRVVEGVKKVCPLPILAKLTPNVSDVRPIAGAAMEAGADGLVLINTCLGMAIDWRRRRPILGNVVGGLSGPAIKPIALRIVHQVWQAHKAPIIAAGGIATLDDVMEFAVAGAAAVQLGTVNFYDPTATVRVLDALPALVAEAGAASFRELVGSLKLG